MKPTLICKQVVIKKSPIHGYGVFAEQDIGADEIIEESHAVISKEMDPGLSNYYFSGAGKILLAFGFAGIYNHSAKPNARFVFDEAANLITFTAIQPIQKGQEILVNYGRNWFGIRKMKVKEAGFFGKALLWPLLRFSIVMSLIVLFLKIT